MPAAQLRQVLAAELAEYIPAGHKVQDDRLEALLYAPAEQLTQAERAALEKLPSEHSIQFVCPPPLYAPVEQFVHLDVLLAEANVPTAHGMQVARPEALL